jgi:inosose dehydratase
MTNTLNLTIGSAPDSWGVWFASDPHQTPWQRCLDEIAAAGYEWTELGPLGYLPTDIAALRTELDKRGLKTSGTFVQADLAQPGIWSKLEGQVLQAGEVLAQLDAKFLVLIDGIYTDERTGAPLQPARLDEAGWGRFLESVHKVDELARTKFGLRMVFHPHADTHVEYEDQMERFFADTDPHVAMCLDTGHFAYRHGDPVAFMRRYYQRIPYLHIKSVDAAVRDRVEAEGIPFGKAVGMDMFCELARGVVDFVAFRDALIECGYQGWAIVEQDMYPAPFDKPLPIARRNRAYLRQIGMG